MQPLLKRPAKKQKKKNSAVNRKHLRVSPAQNLWMEPNKEPTIGGDKAAPKQSNSQNSASQTSSVEKSKAAEDETKRIFQNIPSAVMEHACWHTYGGVVCAASC